MTPTQFTRAVTAARMDPASKTAAACRLVLVDGVSRSEAARRLKLDQGGVSRAVSRLQPRQPCPHCAGTGYVAHTA